MCTNIVIDSLLLQQSLGSSKLMYKQGSLYGSLSIVMQVFSLMF